MKLSEAKLALTFDDVSLTPAYSSVKSRKDPNISTVLHPNLTLRIPIIAAPMNTVTENKMMAAMANLGASSVLHRYTSVSRQIEEVLEARKGLIDPLPAVDPFFVAVGSNGDALERIKALADHGVQNFCVDVAHGNMKQAIKTVEALRAISNSFILMAGNVCDWWGTENLVGAGADIIRVGVGGGSVCKTRVISGHGVPQLTAIEDCAALKYRYKFSLIADGGIRGSGDIVKALAAGADAVMIGNLLAATSETPGISVDGCKTYAGMASESGRSFNGWFSDEKASYVPEGEAIKIPCKGSVASVIDELVGGLRVGMSYAGAMNIKELQEDPRWVRVTENGRLEGTPHGLKR